MLLERPLGAAYQLLAGPFHPVPATRPSAAQVMVIVGDPDARALVDHQAIIQLYGLTTAEAAVAMRLVRGTRLVEVAAELQISLSTVKTHLKRVFEKVGVSRQSELVRLLVSMPRGSKRAQA